MKKILFISVLLTGLMCTFNIKVYASDTIVLTTYNDSDGSVSYVYGISDSALDNDTAFTVNNKSYKLPFGYFSIDGYWYRGGIYAKGNIKAESGNGGSSYSNTDYYPISYAGLYSPTYSGIPWFNDLDEAYKYSNGESYDSSAIIGGDLPFAKPDIGSEYYENHIYNFDKVFNVYRHSTTPLSWGIAWSQPYDSNVDLYEDTGYHRLVGLTIKYPTRDSLAAYMRTIWTEPQSIATTMEYAYNLFTVEGMYSSQLTYLETTIWVDIDMIMQDSNMSNWWNLTHNVDSQQYVFVMRESGNTFWTGIENNPDLNSQGIMQVFRNYYSSGQQFCMALPYLQFVKAQMYTYNIATNTVYNPDFIYWIDVTSPDGTVQERRNFGNPTNITDDNLVKPSEDNNNTGVDFGVPDPSESELQTNYYNSISDSYNNVYNNYYNNYSSNQDILDYLNKYKDGGTQQEIQDAFGYVNSTVDSVSNVPLLLGKLFNGFFPPFVIKLFSALFIIFGVFIVIKIIRHLFL